MISFIVIGKNEGFKLILSINSIYKFVTANTIKEFEILYVDSKSNDASVANVLNINKDIRVAVLQDDCNAAIARNVGAELAKGDILFFLDGDMELIPNFPLDIEKEYAARNYILISGQIDNIFYNQSFTKELSRNKYYPNLIKDKKEFFFGGLFIIEKQLWEKYNGMRTEFVYGEDIDLSIRLSSGGFFLTRKHQSLVFHHTTRKKLGLKELIKNACFSRGYLYRKNIFNPYTFIRIYKSDPTALILLCALLGLLITGSFIFTVLYFALLTAAVIIITEKNIKSIIQRIATQFLRDIFVMLSFLFYFSSPKKVNYLLIR